MFVERFFLTTVNKNPKTVKHLIPISVLVLEEISMVSSRMFELMDICFRKAKNDFVLPFGGTRIIAVGDFYQLPPVPDEDILSGKANSIHYQSADPSKKEEEYANQSLEQLESDYSASEQRADWDKFYRSGKIQSNSKLDWIQRKKQELDPSREESKRNFSKGQRFQKYVKPPVKTDSDVKYCFHSKEWCEMFKYHDCVELIENHRQKNPVWGAFLDRIRIGTQTENDIKWLQEMCVKTRKRIKNESKWRNINPETFRVRLFPTRYKVNEWNLKMESLLSEKAQKDQTLSMVLSQEYHSDTHVTEWTEKELDYNSKLFQTYESLNQLLEHEDVDLQKSKMKAKISIESKLEQLKLTPKVSFSKLTKYSPVAETITIRPNSRVMLLKNWSVKNGLCNGTTGWVVRVDRDGPIVEFDQMNDFYKIPKLQSKIEYRDGFMHFYQIPLGPAWAMTFHKCQGLSMDSADMDLTAKESGQIYVGLSRIRDVSGLGVLNFDPSTIRVNPSVTEFYNRCFIQRYVPIMNIKPKIDSDFFEKQFGIRFESTQPFFKTQTEIETRSDSKLEQVENWDAVLNATHSHENQNHTLKNLSTQDSVQKKPKPKISPSKKKSPSPNQSKTQSLSTDLKDSMDVSEIVSPDGLTSLTSPHSVVSTHKKSSVFQFQSDPLNHSLSKPLPQQPLSSTSYMNFD